jgi:hypothetical protein
MQLNHSRIVKITSSYVRELTRCSNGTNTTDNEYADSTDSIDDTIEELCSIAWEDQDIEQFIAINKAIQQLTKSEPGLLENMQLDNLYDWSQKWITEAINQDDAELLQICTGYNNYLFVQFHPCDWMKQYQWTLNSQTPPEITKLLMSSIYPTVKEWILLGLASTPEVWGETKEYAPRKEAVLAVSLKHNPEQAKETWTTFSFDERLAALDLIPASHYKLIVENIPYGLSLLTWFSKIKTPAEWIKKASSEDVAVVSSIQKYRQQQSKCTSNAHADIALQIDPAYFEHLVTMAPEKFEASSLYHEPMPPLA